MEWFRFYDEVLNDPKVQRLEGDLFKTWVNLLCLANEQTERGSLPASLEDVAWALRLPNETLRERFTLLQQYGFIDFDKQKKCYKIHGWDRRQMKSDDVTARVQKHRSTLKDDETLQERFSNGLDREEKRREDTEKRERTDARAGARANSHSKEKSSSSSPHNSGASNGRKRSPTLSEAIEHIHGRAQEDDQEPDNRLLPPGGSNPAHRKGA